MNKLFPFTFILILCSCSQTNTKNSFPSSLNEGFEGTYYLNSCSYYCKKYESFIIEFKKDFSVNISFKIENEETRTFETKYRYNASYFYQQNESLLEFENYLTEPNDSSEIDFSTNSEIILSTGYCLIDYEKSIIKYSRQFSYGNKSIAPLHAYFGTTKASKTDYFSINKKYSLSEQIINNSDNHFNYFNLSFDNNHICKAEYKIGNSSAKEININYEYLDCVFSQTTSGINLLNDIDAEIITMSGSLSFGNDNSLIYLQSNSSIKNKLVFIEI